MACLHLRDDKQLIKVIGACCFCISFGWHLWRRNHLALSMQGSLLPWHVTNVFVSHSSWSRINVTEICVYLILGNSCTDAMIKALEDLNVADLRRELKERQLNPKGKKEELRERLESWIMDNGYDIDDYEFVDPCLKQISSDIKNLR